MQVVDYATGAASDGAALMLAADDGLRREPLNPGGHLAFSLEERRCAGTIVDGAHEPCDRPAAPRCAEHRDTWVCARCTGTCLKDEMDCHEPHAVYLAGFAPSLVKVGVTREWRLETRLREQGADRGAHIRTVPDGRLARSIEASMTADFPDAVRVERKIEGLHRSVDEEAWRAALEPFDVIETFRFDYGFSLEDRPVREVLATGTVLGVQGRILVLERNGTGYAVDMRDLVGYEVTQGPGDLDLQSSLGAFG